MPESSIEHTHVLNMDQVKVDPKWALRIPSNLALRRKLLPFTRDGEHVLVACTDVSDSQGLQAVERYVSAPVLPHVAEAESLDRALNRIFREPVHANSNQSAPTRVSFADLTGEIESEGENIVALSDEVFHAALIRSATDIHVEPGKHDVRIRLRVDGLLEEYRRIPTEVHFALISRLKVLAGMDIAERRAPQDGRFTLGREETQLIDVRAATIPTKHGERMTLRLLASKTHELTLDRLGMSPENLETFQSCVQRPNGLILLTGPTGCGKSTTLYAAIRRLIENRSVNVITIEDPVEYLIDGISQVEVDTADKVNFHKALRGGLRHDPDVLMIGEIRDEITAEIAIKAALTGHLVFSTLHTNSAASSVTRLVDMGVQPFLVGAVSRLFVAQRLVRKICPRCRQSTPMNLQQAKLLQRPELEGTEIFYSTGCKYCAGSGIVGRTGIFELLQFDKELGRITASGGQESDISRYAASRHMTALLDDAVEKLQRGITSFSEIASTVDVF